MATELNFAEFYAQWYPDEIVQALKTPVRKCLRFHGHRRNIEAAVSQFPGRIPIPWATRAYFVPDGARMDPNSPDYYWMDPASLLPVLALDIRPGQLVGDFCAAPGGKAAFVADLMRGEGTLVANEFSRARSARLRQTLRRFSLTDAQECWTLLTPVGSARVLDRQYAHYFDRILLDVPCSSEAHVLQDPNELQKWTPSRSALLAKRQRKLLLTAWACLKPGGRLVYSTCSISPLENEDNMRWFSAKLGAAADCIHDHAPIGTVERYGIQVLPHRDQMGPLYCSVWGKKE